MFVNKFGQSTKDVSYIGMMSVFLNIYVKYYMKFLDTIVVPILVNIITLPRGERESEYNLKKLRDSD